MIDFEYDSPWFREYVAQTKELCGDPAGCRAPRSYFHNVRPWDYDRIFEHAGFAPDQRVLECGGLHSYFAIAASQRVGHYTCTDSFYWALRDYADGRFQTPAEWCAYLAEKGRGKLTAECADMRCLPYPSDSFDRVISISTIEHVHDDRRGLAEMVRVLKPGGALLLTTEYNPNWSKPYSEADGSYYRVYDRAGIDALFAGYAVTARAAVDESVPPGQFTTLFVKVVKKRLSLLMVVCDEAARLRADTAIGSCRGLADEVVVVVQASADDTLALARERADVVLEHPRLGEAEPSLGPGVAACGGEWVLNLDADEALTAAGAARLPALLAGDADVYALRRLTTVGGRVIEDVPHPRLFRRGRAVAPTRLHGQFAPVPGAVVRAVADVVVIAHDKTAAEQHHDDVRFVAMGAGKTWRDIDGWFDFADVYDRMVAEAPAAGAAFAEVGCWLGRSTAYLADAIRRSGKAIALHAVDTWEGTPNDPTGEWAAAMAPGEPYARFLQNIAECDLARYVHVVRERSVAAAGRFAPGSLDFVYIDAEHTADAVRADIAAWLPRVRPGGAVAGHDYDWPGVRRAVDEAFGGRVERVGRASWFVRVGSRPAGPSDTHSESG